MRRIDIIVYADPTQPQISLSVSPQSGLAPFETTLTIAGPTTLSETTVTVNGPDDAEVTQADTVTYTLGMETPGLYTVSVTATDEEENEYTGTIVVQVLDRDQLDALLQGKWDAMKAGMAAGDIDAALAHFSVATRDTYEEIFTAIADQLPQIASQMREIEMIMAKDGYAKYRIKRSEVHQGATYDISYYIYFEAEENGLWKIVQY